VHGPLLSVQRWRNASRNSRRSATIYARDHLPNENEPAIYKQFTGFSGHAQADAKSVFNLLFADPDELNLKALDLEHDGCMRTEVGSWCSGRSRLTSRASLRPGAAPKHAFATEQSVDPLGHGRSRPGTARSESAPWPASLCPLLRRPAGTLSAVMAHVSAYASSSDGLGCSPCAPAFTWFTAAPQVFSGLKS
jgi:hypothetical protein